MRRRKKEQLEPQEEFFTIPRAEYLLQGQDDIRPLDLKSIIINERKSYADRFSLVVPDNRMANSGICKGDTVIVHNTGQYHDNDVVAVKIGEKVLIRRYYSTDNRIRLEHNTPSRQTMILDRKTPGFAILGHVIQVIREL